MANKVQNEGKEPTSITLYKSQKKWLLTNPQFNFSKFVREALNDYIIRKSHLESIINEEK